MATLPTPETPPPSWTLTHRGNNYLIEGELNGYPSTYPALISASDDGPSPRYSPIYHPDVSQVTTTTGRANIPNRPAAMQLGGLRNFRRVHGRAVGVEGGASRYPTMFGGNDMLRVDNASNQPSTPNAPNARWDEHMHHNWSFRGMRIENHWGAGLTFEVNTGITIEDCIFREPETGRTRDLYGAHLLIWVDDVVIRNSVSPNGAYSPNTARQSTTEKRANTTGAFTTSKTARPVGWTRDDFGFPCGPDAWAA